MNDLFNKKEYGFIREQLLSFEIIIDAIVGEVDSIAHVIVLTNARILIGVKHIQSSDQMIQIGLEQICDLKKTKFASTYSIKIMLMDDFVKIDYLQQKVALNFGRLIIDQINEWTKLGIKNLI